MKKIFLIVVFCMLLSSCDDMIVHMDGWATPAHSNNKKLVVRTYEYDGHTYLIFGHTRFTNGIVHDPDCICNLRKKDYL